MGVCLATCKGPRVGFWWAVRCAQHLAKYAVAVQDLARRFLRLIAEGLGFDNHDFFEGDLSGRETLMNVNYYPRCPNPSLTMGIRPHSDGHLLTILSQGDVSGLQAKHRGRWIRVQPIHNAFVIGLQMEIVTNGLLPSVEHRAVTNSAMARMSVASLIRPKMDCRIGSAPTMLNEETNPPKYKDYTCSEFTEAYEAAAGNRETVLDFFKIHHTQNRACVNEHALISGLLKELFVCSLCRPPNNDCQNVYAC
ncbi:hypothetical protein ACQ4PT_065668 [Festuca glaucescens]